MTLDARTLAVAAALALATALTWWLSRSAQTQTLAFIEGPKHEPDYVVEGYHGHVFYPDGRRKYEVSGTRLTHFRDDGSSELENPYLIQYHDGPPVHTRAQRGWLPADHSHIVMTGNVRSSRGADPKRGPADIATERLKLVLDQ